MTLSTTTRVKRYSGNGSTTIFAYDFRILADTDLTVILTDAAGANTTLTITTDYSVSGAGDAGGGNVTLVTPPATGETLTIYRVVPQTQATDLQNQGPFAAQTHEDALDKLTMIVQELQEQVNRAVQVPVTSTQDPDDYYTDLEGFKDDAETAATAAQTAQTAAETAQTAAETAQTAAETAQTAAEAAQTAAEAGQSGAETAQTAAEAAQTAAETAQAAAETAQTAAEAAQTAAEAAQTAAETAATNAATSESNASTSASTAYTAASAARTAQTAAETAQSAAETAQTAAEAAQTAAEAAAASIPQNKSDATVDPTTGDDSDDGYAVNSIWCNVTDDKTFICQDATVGAAVWLEIGSGGSGDMLAEGTEVEIATTTALDSTAFGNWHKVSDEGLVKSGTYKWTASGSGTNEYYMELDAGGDPGISEPDQVKEDGDLMTVGTMGSLSASEWDWGDNDSLGYSTVYVRLSDGSDPDTQADGYLRSVYAITLPDPSGNANKFIGFYGDSTANLNEFIKIAPYGAETIGGLAHGCCNAERVIVLKCDGTNWQVIVDTNDLAANTQLDITNSITMSALNDWIVCLPHNLSGNRLTIQLADGTYTVEEDIYINGFDNGEFWVVGNSSDSSLSTSKNVYLDANGYDETVFFIENCACTVRLWYMKIRCDTDTVGSYGVRITKCNRVDVRACYILGNDTARGAGVTCDSSAYMYVYDTYFSHINYAIWGSNASFMVSNNNDDTPTQPVYGLVSNAGITIKIGTQPAGSTANELKTNGGQIFS